MDNRREPNVLALGFILVALVLAAGPELTGYGGAVAAPDESAAVLSTLKIDMGPTLGDLATTSALLTWHTNMPSTGWVEVEGEKLGEGGPTHTHRVRLQGLSAGQTYWYTVKAAAGDQSVSVGPHRITTPPESLPNWTFAAYGDTRSRPAAHRRVVAAMLQANPRLILHTGDLVEDGESLDDWYHFFPVIGTFSRNLPFYPAIGNHEHNAALYYELLSIPSGGGEYGTEWYTFAYGNCQFFVLDSCRRIAEQTQWLQQQLNKPPPTGVDWRIAMFHHPAFSSGPHGGNETIQQQWCPLLEDGGVAVVFCGHDHLYERSVHSGVHYITLGTGGAPLYAPGASPNPYSRFALAALGFCRIDIGPTQLRCVFIDTNQNRYDEFTVTR